MTKRKIIEQLIRDVSKQRLNANSLLKLKREYAGRYHLALLPHTTIFRVYQAMVKQGKLPRQDSLEKLLQRRPVRTLSGVAIVSVLTKPYPCPGRCVYCPNEKNMPKSYLANEPAAMRAVLNKFDPFRQVAIRLKSLQLTGHRPEKIELIVIGGTWSYLPSHYQTWFIKRCFEACNGKKSKTLKQAQKINENAQHRIIGITLETRPDYIDAQEIKRMRQLGCTRVEIGVQTLDSRILQRMKRDHNVRAVVKATQLLKDVGLKVCYHLMPNLPGATLAQDFLVFKKVFTDPRFQPDMVKIYPCVVTKSAPLYHWWQQKKYQPYSEQQLITLLLKVKKIVPPYVRINRFIRDIPATSIIAGNKITNLRQLLQAEIKKQNWSCHCIRCREARQQKVSWNDIKLKMREYQASGGTEYFLSFESKDQKVLYAFVRLRLPPPKKHFLKILQGAALIRELHTYGELVPIRQKKSKAVQHLGLGKRLMLKAEKLAQQSGYKKIVVISGIGVRQYYRKLGFILQDTYMVKNLK